MFDCDCDADSDTEGDNGGCRKRIQSRITIRFRIKSKSRNMQTGLCIKEALDKSAEYLGKKGSKSPRLDAEVLLSHVLGLPRLQLYLQFDRPLTEKEKTGYRELLKRRAIHEPVAYITGEKEFLSLGFYVTPAVLIPRPETEILVGEAIKKITAWKEQRPDSNPTVFEVGIGFGVISISLLLHFPDLEISASDVSKQALDIAKKNAKRHGVEERLRLLEGDLFAEESGPFDFIISNPPYVPETEKPHLAPDIIKHEPHSALFAGNEGLDVILPLIISGAKKISPLGWILVEIGKDQYIKLNPKIEASEKFRSVKIVEDYADVVRVLCIMK